MRLISGNELKRVSELIIPENLNMELVEDCSIDLTLDEAFNTIGVNALSDSLDFHKPLSDQVSQTFSYGSYKLKRNGFVLGQTQQTVSLASNMIGYVSGVSSIARLGLSIEDASCIKPNFNGKIVLEISRNSMNDSDVDFILCPGMVIAQLQVFELHNSVPASHISRYINQRHPVIMFKG